MGQKERMAKGLLYDAGDKEILSEQNICLERLYEFNQTRPSEPEKRQAMLKTMFHAIGDHCYIEPPFHASWGGKHVTFGDGVYANFNLTLVDDGDIVVGDYVFFGPNVTLTTAGHPIQPDLRKKEYQFNKKICIGNNVWIGAGAVILPGVSIGDHTVIGAGSVVTKDIPSDVVAVGNPCRVLRQIGPRDEQFFYKNEEIDWEHLR